VFFNYNTYSTPALACLYATSTGGITFTENNCYGTNVTGGGVQLQYGVYVNQTASTQVVISNNVFESTELYGVEVSTVFNLVTITGNTIAQPQVAQSTWAGIFIDGANTTSTCGTGIGLCQVSITGNVVQGPGNSTTSTYGVLLAGFVTQAFVGGNALNYSQYGVGVFSGVTNSTIGQNQIGAGTAISGGTSTTTFDHTGFMTYANRPTGAANGSQLYFTDANAACTAGGSNGQICELISGSWTH
jgi:hypothetical protein